MFGGVHAGDPLGEGEAVVAGKGESLAGGGCVEGDVADDYEDQDDGGQRVDAWGGDGASKDVDEGVAGGIGEGVADRRDTEEIGDMEDQAEGAVEHVGPEHGVWNVDAGVGDFF